MPLPDYKLLVLACQVLSFSQFSGLQARRFSQNYSVFKFEHSLAASFSDMNMNWCVFVTIEEEPESILNENSRHAGQ
jgi:hypothetical protein